MRLRRHSPHFLHKAPSHCRANRKAAIRSMATEIAPNDRLG
jgi:hypothetical protein